MNQGLPIWTVLSSVHLTSLQLDCTIQVVSSEISLAKNVCLSTRPDFLLAAANPLCKSIDLKGITPEKEEFQARLWEVLFRFTALRGANTDQHWPGCPHGRDRAWGGSGSRAVSRKALLAEAQRWPWTLPPLSHPFCEESSLPLCDCCSGKCFRALTHSWDSS